MKSTIILLFMFFGIGALFSQINITEEATVSNVMNSYLNQNRSSDYIKGWKIQIITTSDRRKMEAARSKFKSYYPAMYVEWKHVSPYYHIQVGAFRTKLELQGFLLELKQNFPNAIPVMADIRKTSLLD